MDISVYSKVDGEKPIRPETYKIRWGNYQNLGIEEMLFSRKEHTNLLPGAKLTALKDNAILHRLSKLYLGMYYTYMHAVMTNEKEDMSLKESG